MFDVNCKLSLKGYQKKAKPTLPTPIISKLSSEKTHQNSSEKKFKNCTHEKKIRLLENWINCHYLALGARVFLIGRTLIFRLKLYSAKAIFFTIAKYTSIIHAQTEEKTRKIQVCACARIRYAIFLHLLTLLFFLATSQSSLVSVIYNFSQLVLNMLGDNR